MFLFNTVVEDCFKVKFMWQIYCDKHSPQEDTSHGIVNVIRCLLFVECNLPKYAVHVRSSIKSNILTSLRLINPWPTSLKAHQASLQLTMHSSLYA